MDIVSFDPKVHRPRWDDFIVASYRNPNYVMLSPTFLRWQFFDNPANQTGGYTLWVVEQKEEIVAQLGFVPFLGITPSGEHIHGAYPINLMVRPEYRSVGLGAILLRRLLKQFPCLVNPGVNEAGAALGEGLGMTNLGLLRRYVAIVDKQTAQVLAVNGRLPRGVEEAAPAAANVIVSTKVPDKAGAGFAFPQAAYGAQRSRDFLRWRYESHPAFTYEFIFSTDYRSVLVFHEERETENGILVLRVVDALCRPEHQSALLSAVVLAGKERRAAIVDFFCSLDCLRPALDAAGFFDEAQHADGHIAALFQPLDFRKTAIRVLASCPGWNEGRLEDWYITKADSDQDRPNDRRAIKETVSATQGR
jgi:GNAT superfamily N-acetyltransferase